MPSPPNILWIVTTQWRAAACGYAGDPNAHTPHLDALAAESVNYSQAVTPHPFGPLARAALLTGVPSPENGVSDYFDPLPLGARTIAHDLGARGYATAFFGKWHLAKRDPNAPLVGEAHARMVVPPEGRGGFEFWEGFESGFLLNDPWLHGSRLVQPEKQAGYQSDVVCARAADFLFERRGVETRPWFCVVSLEAPHPPYEAPAAGVAARDPREIILPANVPRGGEAEAQARRELAGYYAHIEATDRAIGRILLPEAKREDTVVVFTSVHGDLHGAHGLFRKGWPHEESVRVPLLIRGQATEDRGRQDHATVSLVDLPAMMFGRIDQRKPKVENEFARISMPSIVARPQQCDRVWRGGRTKGRKLVMNADGSPWLFFDLENDPLEMKNLAGDPTRAGEIAALQARLD
ncbi:MAG: sulfatase [Opitutus sp.]|nr:sulfatase [Opitutus sp.]